MTDVDLDELTRAAAALRAGRQNLEGLASPPTSVDAGDMTAAITTMLGNVVESAGAVSVALAALADGVDASRDDYESTDASAESSFTSFQDAV